jgi:hypothetical protein
MPRNSIPLSMSCPLGRAELFQRQQAMRISRGKLSPLRTVDISPVSLELSSSRLRSCNAFPHLCSAHRGFPTNLVGKDEKFGACGVDQAQRSLPSVQAEERSRLSVTGTCSMTSAGIEPIVRLQSWN